MGTGTTALTTGTGGVLLTTLFGATMLGDALMKLDDLDLPSEPLNVDSAMMKTWLSESLDSNSDEPLDGECEFFNFSKSYTSEFCDAFLLARMQSGTLALATSRALRCAAKAKTECVLSSEVGFAVPAAFLARQNDPAGIKLVIAPRIVPFAATDRPAKEEHVRVSMPTDTFGSRTLIFNDSVRVEFLTAEKRVESDVFSGDEAFCLGLLRIAFEKQCWGKLDG